MISSPSAWLWRLLAPHQKRLLAGLGATLLCGLSAAYVPYWSGRAIHALELAQWHRSRQMLLYMLFFTLLAGVGRYLARNTLIGLSRVIERDQREQIYAFLLSMPSHFYDHRSVGDLMSRIGSDIAAVKMATGPALLSFLQTFSVMPLTLILMFRTHSLLTAYILLPFLVLGVGFYAIGRLSHRNQARIQESNAQLNIYSHETISGEKVVQAYGLENLRIAAFRALSLKQARLTIHQAFLVGLYGPLTLLLGGMATLILVVLGTRWVRMGQLTMGDLGAFVGYLAALTWPVISLGWSFNLFASAKSGQSRIDDLFDSAETSLPAVGVPALAMDQQAPEGLQLINVCYRFEDGRGLGPIHLAVEPGERLAIVGAIGSGKSLLLSLLAGLRLVTAGEVRVGNTTLTHEKLREHWHKVGWVSQDAFLFSCTLRENLTLGVPTATDDDLGAVLKTVALEAFVHGLPQGLDTLVGERGVTLSGGERQRVALARALLRQPSLLLLDDALSAVDAETESLILQGLQSHLQQSTVVLSTHRIFVAELCQRVLVLANGQPVQYGCPRLLASQPGPFARLKKIQTLKMDSI